MAGPRDTYHHGDLRAALIAAAEATLADTGVQGFSLRQVARRVGVSHSAPAYHFGDTGGLIAALATEGFDRLRATMQARQAAAPADIRAQIVASGLGYVEFAVGSPALFRLMFGTERARRTPELAAAGESAFHVLTDGIARLRGVSPFEDAAAMAVVVGCWSLVHGFAGLVLGGRLAELDDVSRREAVLRQAIERSIG